MTVYTQMYALIREQMFVVSLPKLLQRCFDATRCNAVCLAVLNLRSNGCGSEDEQTLSRQACDLPARSPQQQLLVQ